MFLYGNELVKKVRSKCDACEKRMWIVTPFIGEWKSIEKILGRNWQTKSNIDIRLLTDIKNDALINPISYEQFKHRAEIKTLRGLHAKIYIFDDSAIVTSANLTGTAFSKRFEIGVCHDVANNLINIFSEWWELAKTVDSSWRPQYEKPDKSKDDTGEINGLIKRWDLPDVTSVKVFKDYTDYIKVYNHFLSVYLEDGEKLLKQLSNYHEIDAFLNYLYHEHPQRPSSKYKDVKEEFRFLKDKKREKEIQKYKRSFKLWLMNNTNFEDYRFKAIKEIKDYLAPHHIDSLTADKISVVANSLHCQSSYAINKARFLNPENNSVRQVRTAWKYLLHNKNIAIAERMERCNSELNFFGKSSIQELVSWYEPENYPMINTNSNSGLKFLGYDIKAY